MKKNYSKGIVCSVLWIVLNFHFTFGQEPYKVHSHNDYEQEFPFFEAYINNAASIEVDLFLKNKTLYATHEESEIIEGNTFSKLYLDPLKQMQEKGKLRDVQLLIDIKSEAESTLVEIQNVLKKYPSLITEGKVKFVISGNRPKPADYANYPEYILFDHQSIDDLDSIPLEKVAMISLSFQRFSIWNGYGRMVSEELQTVKGILDKVHAHEKPFRFWATPDTKTAWARLAKLGVDFINTDNPALAHNYLESLDTKIYTGRIKSTYDPKYNFDPNTKPWNIILMIGDGNGLAQITAAMIANKGDLSLTNIKDIGLIKTSSYDDLVTDSAAGATAMATGQKANNRAIGLGPKDEVLNSLVKIASSKGYRTGIITTDAIYGATPSSFYAHVKDRDNTQGILQDLKKSNLDFFISGGGSFETELSDIFKPTTLREFNTLDSRTAIYLGDNKMPTMQNGRKDMLPKSLEKSLNVLSSGKKPFFIVVEGAQIDNGGHSNKVSTIVDEMLDFDAAVAEALTFADKTENTLVLITADHETSGFGIVGGDIQKGEVQGDFLTIDHTAIMVPLFAYGPQAQNFRGVYENSGIFSKINAVLDLKK
ncbi:alkaline phosphatase [Maribacter sp. PR1]|uniref:Alkaline phosphatase n=1 Tax=Maribacter cobaltidurans TaxID=1178778 RepID=A0ABU7IPW4_9FLAO|nr:MULTISPECIES: alkaline phosphatase [Maribacter]MDC6387552.1 alkaline phosphatase [Maribacter sp. PR1]MEE1974940.1 alkaline phosphatase [Maribacter cobaltidurans]